MGFVLAPEEARELIARNPKNKDVLFPYLNGEDLNSRPDQSPSRWVINFFDWPIEKAMQYPDCFRIIEEKVKPERDKVTFSKNARDRWWLYERTRPELATAIEGMERVLVRAQVSKTHAPIFAKIGQVFSMMCIIFPLDRWSDFSNLQSNLHESLA
jgi:hypothetical protein